ncbi:MULTISPECIES: hypothetical protein [Streptomyces]|uniref:Uncharacterized protein n=1 Tax=Streptomyces edwardsiae TaxID=3075527 RepID=A0ABU2PRD9_9ACTN|nr:hypothetical protein [Streptomyces sp. DSM 41636]MDT0394366.1 hypothetical protein [Streptomyces sp. DSM 41636]
MVWRRGVGIRVAVVTVGGGPTLWLRDEATPAAPAVRERTDSGPAVPVPRCPVPGIPPDVEDGLVATACLEGP